MSENDLFDELDHELSLEDLWSNKRIAVRYRRKDIQAIVKVHSLFFSRELPVILHDISSKGAAILCSRKLALKNKVALHLQFDDGTRFEIDAIVVHSEDHQKYGLKFKTYQQTLAEHLLQTQTDLNFS